MILVILLVSLSDFGYVEFYLADFVCIIMEGRSLHLDIRTLDFHIFFYESVKLIPQQAGAGARESYITKQIEAKQSTDIFFSLIVKWIFIFGTTEGSRVSK